MKENYTAERLMRFTFSAIRPLMPVLLIMLGIAISVRSEAQQVTLTATGGAPTGTFTTLKGAFDAINAGTHTGAIVVSVNANTTETASAILNSSGTGLANYSSILVQPTANNLTVSGSFTGGLVRLNGADNVIIDGSFGGSRQLRFTNTNASSGAAVIWVSSASSADGATNNIIRNCFITGGTVNTTTMSSNTFAGIISSGNAALGTLADVANSGNTYENNLITRAQYGIAMVGPIGNENGNIIRGNTIGSTSSTDVIRFRGIAFNQQQNVTVSGNTILGVNVFGNGSSNTASGIFVGGTTSGGSIDRNSISGVNANSFWGAHGILLNSTSASTNLLVANNFIYNITVGGWTSLANEEDGADGICVVAGGGYRIVFNSINLYTNETNNSAVSASIFFSSGAGTGNVLSNNIIVNNRTIGTRYAIFSNASPAIFTSINYNDYLSSQNVGFISGAPQASLSNWQSATGQDANSLSVDPQFTSNTDLHLLFSSALNNTGSPVVGVANDFDNDVRDVTNPDIGADEFTPSACTGNNGGTASVSPTSLCASGNAVLSSTGYSFGLGIAYQWEFFNGTIWQAIPGQVNPASANTGTITSTTQFRLRVNCSAGPAGFSTITTVTVNDPSPTSTTGGSRCGVGTVNLSATGSNIKWYSAPSGGLAIGSGNTFTTPSVSSTTTFYASASVLSSSYTGGKPDNTGTGDLTGTFNDAGLTFNATTSFVLNSVTMYPGQAGSAVVEVVDATNTLVPGCNTTVNFAQAEPTGINVPLNFTIPAGTGYKIRIINPITTTLFRNQGVAFPYAVGPNVSITTGFIGASNLTNYYYFYNWQITEICEGNRVPVVATVNTPPAISLSASPTVICSSGSSNLTVTSGNAGYTYVWTPGNLTGPAQTVSPSITTVYTVTATDNSGGAFNGCVNVANLTLSVVSTPTALTISPSTISVCATPPQTVTLTATGGLVPNQTAFSETFNPMTQFTTNIIGGTGTVASNTTYFQEGTASFRISSNALGVNNVAMEAASNINLSGFTSPTLSFWHIAALENGTTPFDVGFVEFSTNGGGSWTTFPASSYTGSGTLFGGAVGFTTLSYPDWVGNFISSQTTIGVSGPAASFWKQETIDLTPWQGNAAFRIRFRMQTDPSVNWYGWLIDNVRITGTAQAPITWTSVPVAPTELFISVGPNVAYSGQNSNTVYSIPSINHVYTATASSGGSCQSSTTSTVNVVGSNPVSVSIAANPGNTICAGASVTFTATPTNGGTVTGYNWLLYNAATTTGPNAGTTINVASTAQLTVGSQVQVVSGTGSFVVGTTIASIPNGTQFTISQPVGTALAAGAQIAMTLLTGNGLNTFTTSSLQNGQIIAVIISSNLSGGCITNNPATSNQIAMTVNPVPTVSISGGSTVCTGAPTLLTATASVTPGSISSYQWFRNGISQGAAGPSSTFSATLPGSYTVTVVSAAGCSQTSAAFVVTQPTYVINASAGPNGSISPAGAVIVNCGDNQTFTITPNASFSIADVVVNGTSVGPVSSYTFTNVTSGPQSIVATFQIVGCGSPPSANAGGPTGQFCANQSYTLNGSYINATAASWSGGAGTFSPNNSTLNASYTPTAAEIAAGTVTLTLTTNNPSGAPCVPSTSNIVLTINPIPTVSISGTLGFCPSSSTTLTANASITPPGTITYAWIRNGVTPLGTSVTQLANVAGTYQVTATGNGCSNAASVSVVAFTPPSVTISGSNVICTNAATTLNAAVVAGSASVPANGYIWRRGGTIIVGATTSTLITSIAGSYTVIATDANGCASPESAAFVVSADVSPLNGNYTISTSPASCTNYISFASAINDLNTRGISGPVRFLVQPGFTETAPTGGLSLGSVLLNGNSVGRSITFERDGAGANPVISAQATGNGTPTSAAPDGIWSIRGTDNVTIDAINLVDGNTQVTPVNRTMEFGFGLFKWDNTDGVQNATISNCVITLNRNNAASGTAAVLPDGATGIMMINGTSTAANVALAAPTVASGSNSNNRFYGNTIQNSMTGIALFGVLVASPFTLADQNNDIGGSSTTTGNTIINFGGVAGGGTPIGIVLRQQWGANVSFNTINNNNGGGISHNGQLWGIRGFSGTSASVVYSFNNISLSSGSTSQTYTALDNAIGGTPAGNTVSINNNSIAYTNVTAGPLTCNFVGITNTAGPSTLNVNNNTLDNINLSGTGNWSAIQNFGNVANLNVSGNNIRNNNVTSNGATYNVISNQGTVTNLTVTGNRISGNSKTTPGAGTVSIFYIQTGQFSFGNISGNRIEDNLVNASAGASTINLYCLANNISANTITTVSFTGNVVMNNRVLGTSGATAVNLRGISLGGINTTTENYLDNQVSRLFITGNSSAATNTINGILSLNTTGLSVKTVARNRVDTLYMASTIANGQIAGFNNTQGLRLRVYENKIGHIVPGGTTATNSWGRGIWVAGMAASGATVSIMNNMVNMDLTQFIAPAANNLLTAVDAYQGINISANSITDTVAYNTVRLAGAGSGTSFGSSAFTLASTTANTFMANNIFVNQCTPGGGAGSFTTAFRIAAAAPPYSNYLTNSDNNNFFAGTPSATRVLFLNGSSVGFQTIAAYQAGSGIAPREANSLSVLPSFVSAIDLHLNPSSNCDLDGAGKPILAANFDKDIDGDIRDTNVPDIGADEHTGSGGSGVWKGYNTNWHDAINWCGVVPTASTNVVIPSGKTNYPLITANNALCNNINIAAGGSVSITGVGKLAISGSITNAGTFNVSDGTVEFAGTTAQTIPANAFTSNNIKNIVINNATVNLGGALNLLDSLSFKGNNRTFATAGNLTLKSTATRTARVADVTNNSANTGNTVTGDVTVERFISAKRAWRFLAVPTQHNLQTIKDAWQEGALTSASNPVPGFGINIPSNRASWSTDGFDQYTPNGGPSIKTYNPATNGWTGVVSTINVTTPTASNGRFVEGEAYMTFIRGDRSVNSFPSSATTTVLREKGALRIGSYTVNLGVAANQFKGIGNPYAAPVDFEKLTKVNMQNAYYLWDPKVGTLGGWITFIWNPATSTYDASQTIGTSYENGNKLIESGSAFLVRATSAGASLTFNEPHKATGSNMVQRGPSQHLRASLFQVPASGIPVVVDGVLSRFDPSFNNEVNYDDAADLTNFAENLAIWRNDQLLATESRNGLVASDTIYYRISQMRAANYQFAFNGENINQYGLQAFLKDNYLNTMTPISLEGNTVVPFTIVNEPGSYAADRFMLVFKQLAPVPVSFTSVRAEKANQDILVSWKVENETRIAKYEVEESADGRSFVKIGERIATGNNGSTVQYNWLDRQVINGYNYYRIRSVGVDGEVKYSEVVKINIRGQQAAEFIVYPVPVREDGLVQISMNNAEAGNYVISLYNNLGQVVYRKQIGHGGGSSVYSLEIGRVISHGNYQLELRSESSELKQTFNIIY